MYFGIINASATLLGYDNKMIVVTKGFASLEAAEMELERKVSSLPRRERLSFRGIGDRAIIKICSDEDEFFRIPDGYFGTTIVLPVGQEFVQRD